MTASNHVVTGCAFAVVTAPLLPWWVILPTAFLLHFLLDALPHYGQPDDWGRALKRLRWLLPLDASVGGAVLLSVVLLRPEYWQLVVASGVLCASADLFSIARYHRFLAKGDTAYGKNWFVTFHHQIQWAERLWGVWVELAWFTSISFVLYAHILYPL